MASFASRGWTRNVMVKPMKRPTGSAFTKAMPHADEATSSVDTRTELLVQRAMGRLRRGRTSFVIAHRLPTIRNADLIVYMENGNVLEQGSHHELIARRGAFRALQMAQAPEAA